MKERYDYYVTEYETEDKDNPRDFRVEMHMAGFEKFTQAVFEEAGRLDFEATIDGIFCTITIDCYGTQNLNTLFRVLNKLKADGMEFCYDDRTPDSTVYGYRERTEDFA